MPKIVDHDQQREELLTRCFELFARQGYGRVTMRSIAREAGVSTGTLYHYFSDKESILEQMFELMGHRDQIKSIEYLEAKASPIELMGAFSKFVEDNESHLQNLLLVAVDVYRHAPGPRSRELVHRVVGSYRDLLFRTLRLPDTDLASLMLAVGMGQLIQRMLDQPGIDWDAQGRWLMALGSQLPFPAEEDEHGNS